jgi:phenylacetate-CoA ligase
MYLLDSLKLAIARRKLSSRSIQAGSEDPLEVWIHNKIRKEFRSSKELRKSLGKEKLETIERHDVREYQLHKFRKLLEYADENSIYYRRKLKEAGIEPASIRTWEDLERIPPTDPEDLAKEPFHFLCVSQSKIMRAFTTSGTSGIKKRLFYSTNDVLNIIDSISAALKAVGMAEDDTLQIMFPAVAAWDPGLMLDGACKVAGMRSVLASTIDVDQQIETMRKNHTTLMIGLTSFIYRITVLAKEKYDLRSLGIKAIICSAEPLPESVRQELIEAWGCKILSQFGMTEMGLASAIECEMYDGLHLNDADFLVEVVDTSTGRHTKERDVGEMLWTSLSMEGTPLIRYRTHDLSCLIEPPCGCGMGTIGKIGKILGRMDAQTKIGNGQKIYPLLFDEALHKVPGVLSFSLVLDRKGFRDQLTFRVEYMGEKEAGKEKILETLSGLDEIKESLDNDLMLPPIVEMLEVDQMTYTPKQQVIVDRREKDDNFR